MILSEDCQPIIYNLDINSIANVMSILLLVIGTVSLIFFAKNIAIIIILWFMIIYKQLIITILNNYNIYDCYYNIV